MTDENIKPTFYSRDDNQIPKNIEYILVGSKKNLQNTYEHFRSLGLENLANPKNFKIHDL